MVCFVKSSIFSLAERYSFGSMDELINELCEVLKIYKKCTFISYGSPWLFGCCRPAIIIVDKEYAMVYNPLSNNRRYYKNINNAFIAVKSLARRF